MYLYWPEMYMSKNWSSPSDPAGVYTLYLVNFIFKFVNIRHGEGNERWTELMRLIYLNWFDIKNSPRQSHGGGRGRARGWRLQILISGWILSKPSVLVSLFLKLSHNFSILGLILESTGVKIKELDPWIHRITLWSATAIRRLFMHRKASVELVRWPIWNFKFSGN